MVEPIPIFKNWVPEWLIKAILFVLTLPSIVLFFLPLSNVNAAAGYYGSEPADMQFAVALFYAGYVGAYILERRFFNFFAAKEYFLLFIILQVFFIFICYSTKELYVFLPIRFLQGVLFSSTVNLSLTLMFTRLKTERAREVSFSLFFGLLLCALPINNLITADIIDAADFNIVYKCAIFSYLPGLFILLFIMNKIRFGTKFPLYQLDWQSFSLFSILLCLIGYVMIYGQEYYWLDDVRIRYSTIGIVVLLLVFVIRQQKLRRPYIYLDIFKYRNFKVGLLMMFLLYICRFASGLTNGLFSNILKFDPVHVAYMNILNMLGIVLGVVFAFVLIIQKRSVRVFWLIGFIALLLFHGIMFYQFDIAGNEFNYWIPLLLQGFGVGVLIVPTIVFTVSSVSNHLGTSATLVCLAVRYLGYIASIAIMNFAELYKKSTHYNAFQDWITNTSPIVKQRLYAQAQKLISHGMAPAKAAKASRKLLVQAVNTQSQLRYSMDYYEIMAWLIMGIILFIAFMPYLNRTALRLRSNRLSPS